MDDFEKAYAYMLGNEGSGFSNHKLDRGGATKAGISVRFLRQMFEQGSLWVDLNKDNVIDEKDIILLSENQIKNIYKAQFWEPVKKITPIKLAIKVFDTGVNIGIGKAICALQKILNVVPDGIIGQVTLGAIRKYGGIRTLSRYVDNLINFYQNIVSKNPSQRVFLAGWLARANRVPDIDC